MFRVRNYKLAMAGANVEFIRSPNIGGVLDPRFLVIHYTASGPGFDTARYFARPEAKVSAHLVIRRDGTVIQCVPFDTVGWHAGVSQWTDRTGRFFTGLNRYAIGIEIENWGPLRRTGSGWISWSDQPVEGSKVIEARHKFGRPDCGWETFTEAQVQATIEAARAICDAYGITEIVGHDDIAPGRKSDPGPAWNMASFKAKVFGRSEDGPATYMVRSPTGLNLRVGPGIDQPLRRPDPLPDGTRVIVHEARDRWRLVSVLNAAGDPDFSGWVHGGFLVES
ncbi:N-acetylmuramoyl-L-alanine amidase [Bosea sp. F3-2]|uniref:N-acetylmuramoyl-L-alanine amidase n=1 Tax=Bosea sp. F3-2 TaxID=2599640 RepID=UPI0011EEAE3F|nr:N-acetylmuramoyl-L-alanine amidase [Bosea sp. F3-2]QEL25526.1 N-acetylmuramoyl-L-alanine amidase [Bosea sp. F3-2]